MVRPTSTSQAIQQLLDDWQTTLSELEATESRKLSAVGKLDAHALFDIAQAQSAVADRLHEHVHRRRQLLADAGLDENQSLGDLVVSLPPDQRVGFEACLATMQQSAVRMKQRIASTWLTTYRLNEHIGDVLGLLSRAGRPREEEGYHGLMMDSTA